MYENKILFDLYHVSNFMLIPANKLIDKYKKDAIKYLIKNNFGDMKLNYLLMKL